MKKLGQMIDAQIGQVNNLKEKMAQVNNTLQNQVSKC